MEFLEEVSYDYSTPLLGKCLVLNFSDENSALERLCMSSYDNFDFQLVTNEIIVPMKGGAEKNSKLTFSPDGPTLRLIDVWDYRFLNTSKWPFGCGVLLVVENRP